PDTGSALFEENLKRMIIQDDCAGIKLLIEDDTISPIIALCSRKCLNKNDSADSIKVFNKLVEYNFNLKSVSNDGQNGVHFAIKHGNLHLVAPLIKHGVNFRLLDKNQRSPLSLAASIGSMAGVRIISSFFTGSDVDIADLKSSSVMTHNYSIKSYIELLVSDPSLIKPIEFSDLFKMDAVFLQK
ncbi:hypothetical protein MXB_4549, partial [Myxobolus squamalis]